MALSWRQWRRLTLNVFAFVAVWKLIFMPTLSDVAKACNVSAMTVSCVLNNKPGRVSAATRERVLQTVRELNYHPNAVARGLTGRRLNTLGVVYLHSHEPIHTADSFVMMLDGILDKATREKQDTLMCTSYSWQDGVQDVSRLLDRRCDGLILVVPTLENPLLSVLRQTKTPTALLCSKSEDAHFSFADTDNIESARRLVHHVLEKGHRRVGVIHNPEETRYLYCRERIAGYRLALQDQRLPLDLRGTMNRGGGRQAAEDFVHFPPSERPTAFFAISDAIALDFMHEIQARGFRVPDDVSVVGFDDIARAATTPPGLTTMRQPLKQIGSKCVELLLAQLSGAVQGGRHILFETEYVERGSLAASPVIASL